MNDKDNLKKISRYVASIKAQDLFAQGSHKQISTLVRIAWEASEGHAAEEDLRLAAKHIRLADIEEDDAVMLRDFLRAGSEPKPKSKPEQVKAEPKRIDDGTTTTTRASAFAEPKVYKNTTRRKLQNHLRKTERFYLNDPQPCTWGYKGGNWSAEDVTGKYWLVINCGSDYDTVGYIRGVVRADVWQQIAHSRGYHLTDV